MARALVLLVLLGTRALADAHATEWRVAEIQFNNLNRVNAYTYVRAQVRYRFVEGFGDVNLQYALVPGSFRFSPTYIYEGQERPIPPGAPTPAPTTIRFAARTFQAAIEYKRVVDRYTGESGVGMNQTAPIAKSKDVQVAVSGTSDWLDQFSIEVEENEPFRFPGVDAAFRELERREEAQKIAAEKSAAAEKQAAELKEAQGRRIAEQQQQADRNSSEATPTPNAQPVAKSAEQLRAEEQAALAEQGRKARAKFQAELEARDAERAREAAQRAERDRRTSETMIAVGSAAAPLVEAGLSAVDNGVARVNADFASFSQNVVGSQFFTDLSSSSGGGYYLHRGGAIFAWAAGFFARQSVAWSLEGERERTGGAFPAGSVSVKNLRSTQLGFLAGPALTIPLGLYGRPSWYVTVDALGIAGLTTGPELDPLGNLQNGQLTGVFGLQAAIVVSRRIVGDFELGLGPQFGLETSFHHSSLGSVLLRQSWRGWTTGLVLEVGFRHMTSESRLDRARRGE